MIWVQVSIVSSVGYHLFRVLGGHSSKELLLQCFRGQKFRDKWDHSGDYSNVRNTDASNKNKELYVTQLYFSQSVYVCVSASPSLTLSSLVF